MVEQFVFCRFSDGREVTGCRITNHCGESVVVTDYGATIISVNVLDGLGRVSDVVLGPDAKHFENGRFTGSILGRCANRIACGTFELDGKRITLNTVDAEHPHHLHGGKGALGKKFFQILPYEKNGESVTLTCRDMDEDGWGCTADITVTYTFDDQHRLAISYEANPQGSTLLNLCNHVHFNLDMPNEVTDHVLKVEADDYAADDPAIGMPGGKRQSLRDMPFDFNKEKSFAEAFAQDKNRVFNGRKRLEINYLIRGEGFRRAAELSCPASGRRLIVFTDAECLTVCTPDIPRQMEFKHHMLSGQIGVCLETQYVPNAVNCDSFRKPIFRAAETMRTRTVYQFIPFQTEKGVKECR